MPWVSESWVEWFATGPAEGAVVGPQSKPCLVARHLVEVEDVGHLLFLKVGRDGHQVATESCLAGALLSAGHCGLLVGGGHPRDLVTGTAGLGPTERASGDR